MAHRCQQPQKRPRGRQRERQVCVSRRESNPCGRGSIRIARPIGEPQAAELERQLAPVSAHSGFGRNPSAAAKAHFNGVCRVEDSCRRDLERVLAQGSGQLETAQRRTVQRDRHPALLRPCPAAATGKHPERARMRGARPVAGRKNDACIGHRPAKFAALRRIEAWPTPRNGSPIRGNVCTHTALAIGTARRSCRCRCRTAAAAVHAPRSNQSSKFSRSCSRPASIARGASETRNYRRTRRDRAPPAPAEAIASPAAGRPSPSCRRTGLRQCA